VLTGQSGKASSGEILAIMGPSGTYVCGSWERNGRIEGAFLLSVLFEYTLIKNVFYFLYRLGQDKLVECTGWYVPSLGVVKILKGGSGTI